jgi:predicted phage tail protein
VDTLELRPPSPPSNLSFDPSFGIDRLEARWDASPTPDVANHNVYRSDVQGGPYVQANADPVRHTLFLDTGLAASTTYFYVVTAIDSSGNESAASAEGSASTNPPQISGFPIKMKSATVGSPLFGDLDGDGDLEIVQGDRWVYAWHHDGFELIDGDDDPQSWGVLTTRGKAAG